MEPIGVDTASVARHSGWHGTQGVWPGAGRPGRAPKAWAAPDFKLQAPEPTAKRGGVSR